MSVSLRTFAILTGVLMLQACTPQGQQATAPAQPMPPATTTEVVNMSLTMPEHLARLSDALEMDPPARIELHCPQARPICAQALAMIDAKTIPVQVHNQGAGLRLVYERIIPTL